MNKPPELRGWCQLQLDSDSLKDKRGCHSYPPYKSHLRSIAFPQIYHACSCTMENEPNHTTPNWEMHASITSSKIATLWSLSQILKASLQSTGAQTLWPQSNHRFKPQRLCAMWSWTNPSSSAVAPFSVIWDNNVHFVGWLWALS